MGCNEAEKALREVILRAPVVRTVAVRVPGMFTSQGELRAEFSSPVKELSDLYPLNFPRDAVDDGIKIVFGHGISEGEIVGGHSSTRTYIECSGPPTLGCLIPEEDNIYIYIQYHASIKYQVSKARKLLSG